LLEYPKHTFDCAAYSGMSSVNLFISRSASQMDLVFTKHQFRFTGSGSYLVGLNVSEKLKILKNPVPESEPTPLGFWREVLTDINPNAARSDMSFIC